jgi:diguanylate cyclase (GGDEF)-like protein
VGKNTLYKFQPLYVFQGFTNLVSCWLSTIRHHAEKRIDKLIKTKIEVKLALAYIPLVLSIIFISLYAIINLKDVKIINTTIIENDMILKDSADKMADHLLAQESFGRRYMILRSPYMLDLYWQRNRDFERQIERMRKVPEPNVALTNKIERLYQRLNNLYRFEFQNLEDSKAALSKENDQKMQDILAELISLIKKLESNSQISQQEKIFKANRIGRKTYIITVVLLYFGIFFGVGTAFYIIRSTLRTINQLKKATQNISTGKFELIANVKSQDELGELAMHFSDMTECLARREKASLDSNPLTGLPGGVAIENVLKRKLEETFPLFAFCFIDLDNFKAFNDRYGYAMGNEVIKTTARIARDAVVDMGIENDFVGHIGGDDFVILTSPEKYTEICQRIIEEFDRKIVQFYNAEDLERGWILSKTRRGEVLNFPIMTISIAVVLNDQDAPTSYYEIAEIAAELKKYAKTIPKSVFIKDRRVENSYYAE